MNICFFSTGHISKHRGGVDMVTTILSEEFACLGHNIFQMSVWAPQANEQLQQNQAILPDRCHINCKENQLYLFEFIKKRHIDVIINQSEIKEILELIKSSSRTIPVISVMHTDPAAAIKAIQDNWDLWKIQYGAIKFTLLSPYLYLRRLYQIYTRRKYTQKKHQYYYNQSSALVLLSEKFFNSFKKVSGITDTKKLYAISNPHNFKVQKYDPKEKENIVLFVGRLVFQKRLDRLFKIWNRVKDKKNWKLIIIGDGPERYFYETLCRKWNVENIEFKGLCNPQPFYQKAKVLCMTSSFEGYGMVLAEAMQYDVIPIVFLSYESVTDIITENTNGIIIKAFSINTYANKLSELINNKEWQESLQHNIAYSFSGANVTNSTIINLWEELLIKVYNERLY